ncbi:MAG: hypothetical protein HC819_20400 [Cyclobacteriaceae bacterium]|nr:hypothetical protein [Cyclobacteriaceae bacterium]
MVFFASGNLPAFHSFPPLVISSLVFWSTLLIYQINTKAKINISVQALHRSSLRFSSQQGTAIIILLVIVFGHVPFLQATTIVFLFHLGIISILYNVPDRHAGHPFLPLRFIPVLKIFLIAYVWAALASLLPGVIARQPLCSTFYVYSFVSHFSFILAITLPFDIRDYKADQLSQLVTIPQLIGLVPTKILALLCLGVFAAFARSHIHPVYFIVFLSITALLILFASAQRHRLYYVFCLDGTIILYFIAITLSVI